MLFISRELAKLQKEYVSVETSIEQKRLERHNLLLACKVQDIQIELLQGKLEEISEVNIRNRFSCYFFKSVCEWLYYERGK